MAAGMAAGTSRSGMVGETGQEPGRHQPRDPQAHGAAYARDGDRDRDRHDAQQAEGKISHRRGRVRQLNDKGEPEARGQARNDQAGSPPPHDRQASPRAGGQGQRASRQAGQHDRDVTEGQQLEKPSGRGDGPAV